MIRRVYWIIGVLFFILGTMSAGCIRSSSLSSLPAATTPSAPAVRNVLPPRPEPDGALLQFKRGVQLLENGKNEEARLLFERLRNAYPKMGMVYMNLGVTYKRLGLLPEAISSYQRALEIERGDAEVYYNLAIALREQGEFRKAEAAYKTALVISPDFIDAHYNLAVLYDLYLNDPDEAIRHYQRFLELGGGDSKEIQIWISALQKRIDDSRRSP
jgi:tetratricopeptide (TPR) repeat protein